MPRSLPRSLFAAVLLVTCVVSAFLSSVPASAAPAGAAPPSASPFVDLPQRADALVVVRFLTKLQAPGLETDVDSEIDCVVVSPRGLILCSNALLGGQVGALGRLMGRTDLTGLSSRPRDLTVRGALDPAGSEWPATLIARDSDRDLAWLLPVEPPAEPLPFLDFANAAEAAPGEPFYLLRRMDRFFGGAPIVADGRIAAVIDKPRRLIVPSQPPGWLGAPVFAADGRLLGLSVAQIPAAEDSRALMSRAGRSLPAQRDRNVDMVGGTFLPAAEVVAATAMALEIYAADQAEEMS